MTFARILVGLGTAMLVSALHAQPHKDVFDRSAGYKDEALKLLERLVNIDSGSANTAGLEKVRGMAVEELQKLGGTIETFPATPHPGTNVVATLKGTGKAKILLMAHMDTVFKEGLARPSPSTSRTAAPTGRA